MIGAPVGFAIGAPFPAGGTDTAQALTAGVDFATDINIGANKLVITGIDLSASMAFAVDKIINTGVDFAVSIPRAIDRTLTAAGMTLSVTIATPRNVIQALTAAITLAASVTKTAGINVQAGLAFSVSMVRNIGKLIIPGIKFLVGILRGLRPDQILADALKGSGTKSISGAGGSGTIAGAGSATRSVTAGGGAKTIFSGFARTTVRRR